jgi:hypothetical protein
MNHLIKLPMNDDPLHPKLSIKAGGAANLSDALATGAIIKHRTIKNAPIVVNSAIQS